MVELKFLVAPLVFILFFQSLLFMALQDNVPVGANTTSAQEPSLDFSEDETGGVSGALNFFKTVLTFMFIEFIALPLPFALITFIIKMVGFIAIMTIVRGA